MTLQDQVRQQILNAGLSEQDFSPDPIDQFTRWLEQARDAGIRYPTAMSLSTVDLDGAPTQRMVMMRALDQVGLVFYTSLSSAKSEHVANDSRVNALFPWHMLERQVLIQGVAEPLTRMELLKSFASRPKNSQLAAWLSQQPSPIKKRQLLETKLREIKQRFANGEVSMPAFWGGYRIVPSRLEFWQTGNDLINDRLVYQRSDEGWLLERVAP
jgi:pyridoxamine 5'-phosphate oxidase